MSLQQRFKTVPISAEKRLLPPKQSGDEGINSAPSGASLMSLQQRFKTIPVSPDKRLLTPKQSVVYVGLSVGMIYDMIRDRLIPHIIRPGTGNRPKYLIDKFDWDRWIERRKVSAIA
jgi:Helix-turn-helix domain